MGIPKTDPQSYGPQLKLQSVPPQRSSKSSFKLHAAAIAVSMLLVLVSGLHAATTIVAVCGLGPIKSTDGGVTWSVIPVNVTNGILSGQPTLRVIGYDPRAPSTTWYAHGDAGGTYGFYRTTDGGQTWTGTPLLNFIPASIPGSIVVDPGATNVIYMIVYAATPGKNYIVKSTDLGLTWSKIPLPATASYPASSSPDGTPAVSIATDRQQSGVLYAVGGHYVFKTADFGATWTTLSTGVDTSEKSGQPASAFPSLLNINTDPRASTTLYVSAGASFVASNCKATPAGGQCGMYKSADGGATWTQLGLQSYTSSGVSIDPVSGAMYAGGILSTGSGAIYKSTDGGTNWTPVKNGLNFASPRVFVDPNTPTTVYAQQRGSTNGFYYISTDAGATWSSRPLPALCQVTNPKCSTAPTTDLADFFLVPPPLGGGAPTISSNGVVNGASFKSGITPNAWATIQGSNLAPKTDDWSKAIVNGQFPATLDNVSVSLGGKAAYIYFITPNQLNVLVPADLPLGPLQVTVTVDGQTSTAASVTSTQYAPAFFLWPGNQAVATRQDYSLAVKPDTFVGTTTVASKPGDVLILWGTGFGPTDPPAPSGSAVPADKTYSTTNTPTVTINNVQATVYGAALASSFAALYQIAIQVPPSLTDGDWPIQVAIAGVQSPAGVVLSVHR
jgi:uncharacterized protein (TIGR03437 family)